MNRFILPALVLVLSSCTQPIEEDHSIADLPAPDLTPSYAPGEGPEPPEGYCQPFTTHKEVHSPLALEIDLLYCYQYSDFLARLYVYEHGGISCGQLGHLYAPYIDETWHCGSRWYIWIPY